jgi:hypothetical protein
MTAELVGLEAVLAAWPGVVDARSNVTKFDEEYADAVVALIEAKTKREALPQPAAGFPLDLAGAVRELLELLRLGKAIGPINGHCPLCAAEHNPDSFAEGVRRATERATEMDTAATLAARIEQAIQQGDAAVKAAERILTDVEEKLVAARAVVEHHAVSLAAFGYPADTSDGLIRDEIGRRRLVLDDGLQALRILGTVGQNVELERAQAALAESERRLIRAQERAGRARRAEVGASALYDAARRSAAETLDLRLNRVLPLMAELYKRLRPHPFWDDIEYAIRGDVRRFLALQVGDALNPQFLFSSGQRRATGMAFLLSINLSLTWSRWRTMLLDDPVQHIDDFRAIHLAEVLAQLVSAGRQVIVAVEDPALADMLCHRLPVTRPGAGWRISLGHLASGAAGIQNEYELKPLARRAFAGLPAIQAG